MVLLLQRQSVWSSADVAHLLQGLTFCFRNSFLHTLVKTRANVGRTSLPIILWTLTSTKHFPPHTCYLLDIFSCQNHISGFLCKPVKIVCENLSRSGVSKILTPANLALTVIPVLCLSLGQFELQQVIHTTSRYLNELSCCRVMAYWLLMTTRN